MEEVTSNMTIAVMMDYLVCHDTEYSEREDPIFAGFDVFAGCNAHAWGIVKKTVLIYPLAFHFSSRLGEKVHKALVSTTYEPYGHP